MLCTMHLTGVTRSTLSHPQSFIKQHCITRVPFAERPSLARTKRVNTMLIAAVKENGNGAALPLGADLPSTYADPFDRPSKGRRSGIILHPTSLPGDYGIGELGQQTLNFINWLEEAGCGVWQVLPLVPPDNYGSPYSSTDALCGNTMLIAIDELVSEGLLDEADKPATVPVDDVDFEAVAAVKEPLLDKAADRLLKDAKFKYLKDAMVAFRADNAWIEDSALFAVLSALPEHADLCWWDWEEPLAKRDPGALQDARAKYEAEMDRFVAKQFLFDRQWKVVKDYAAKKDILIVGDMPIYVGGHSADVWANSSLFSLAEDGTPVMVSGVPPDAFSETGQLWGSPLYDWDSHRKEGYKWWAQRLGRQFKLYDEVRIDHFRGFAGYWAVEAWRDNAMIGTWKAGPAEELFVALEKELGGVPILAEDLGVITPDVDRLRENIGAPGMLILQFAWGGGSKNLYLPHNHYENAFVYPGTHDNETTVGWWKDTASPAVKQHVINYLNLQGKASDVDIAWLFLQVCCRSVAKTAVFQMQDVMSLDNSARMNVPGKAVGNWAWRVGDSTIWQQLKPEAARLYGLNDLYDRLPKVEIPKPKAQQPERTLSTLNSTSRPESPAPPAAAPAPAASKAAT